MPHTYKARVVLENKYIQDVTVQADDQWRAQAIIERQYGHIISGPQQVFESSPTPIGSSSGNDWAGILLAWIIVAIIVVGAVVKYWPF
jgi:hypothetical protein